MQLGFSTQDALLRTLINTKTIFDLPEPLKLCSLCVHSRVWPEPAKWWDSDLKEKIDFFHFFCRLFEGEGQKFISLKSARSTAARVVE